MFNRSIGCNTVNTRIVVIIANITIFYNSYEINQYRKYFCFCNLHIIETLGFHYDSYYSGVQNYFLKRVLNESNG